jgi:hypothetical protein
MRKIPSLTVAAVVLVFVVAEACSPAATAPQGPAAESLPTQPPTIAPATSEPANQAPVPAAPTPNAGSQPSPAAQLAPLCETANACPAVSPEQHEIGCVEKIPYTNVLVPPNTQFEVMDKSGDFNCRDSGTTVDGKTVLTCYGKQLYSFDLKLTGAACGGSLNANSDQCQQGYGYDSAQQCCAPLQAGESGSSTVHVDLGACPLPRTSAGG